MPKTSIEINFAAGLDTKTDSSQVAPQKFLQLNNAVFDRNGQLKKRNGFGAITSLPSTGSTALATLQNSLVALGPNLLSYSEDISTWNNIGQITPVQLSTQPAVRNSNTQSQPDSALAANGLQCVVWQEGSSSYYEVQDSSNSKIVVQPTLLPSSAVSPRVVVLGSYFVVTFVATIAAAYHLQYIAVPTSNPGAPGSATDIATSLGAVSSAYDVISYNNTFIAVWANSGGSFKARYATSVLNFSALITIEASTPTQIAMCVDSSLAAPLFLSWFDGTHVKGALYDLQLNQSLAPTNITAPATCNAITCYAQSGTMSVVYQIQNTYASGVRTDYLQKNTMTSGGSVGTAATLLRGVGLASKAFIVGALPFMLVAYGQSNTANLQPSYFLINASGQVIMRLAYANGAGYITGFVLPSVTVSGSTASFAYLFADQIYAVNRTAGSTKNGIYAQVGVNIASCVINASVQQSAEAANSLHLTGGQLWQYDGSAPVEHGFHVWPDDITTAVIGSGGSMSAQQYYYIACYEWTDAAGCLHRSAPSLPVGALCSAGSSKVTVVVPTLRLTAKTTNKVRLVLYRWSAAQQSYYQITSITSPQLNDTTMDSISYVDTVADSSILGNTLLYTTGGVVENIGAPASIASCLHQSRLFLLDAEDRNLIWYSKQIISGTPVELSDLFTLYVPPTAGAQGNTGSITALASMDDKLIIFKQNAIYYLTGTGPDNTGANNDFGSAIFVTSAAGCTNINSIVATPNGLMFQSNKGIWLLGRNLSTSYIGAPVNAYNAQTINSALVIPGTNQVRFGVQGGGMLVYDYYVNEWSTFDVASVSSVVWQGYHALLTPYNSVLQETPGVYIDSTSPVLLSFQTAWIKSAALQESQRVYWYSLLGQYISPHKLTVSTWYDYSSGPAQTTLISPNNYNGAYGGNDQAVYGGQSPYGGTQPLEQWRIFPNKQKCQSISVQVQEQFDNALGTAAGAGLTLSGINFVVMPRTNYPKLNNNAG